MYYWDFVNMKKAPSLVREAAEDIYLLMNGEWDYEDTKANEKMMRIFENPEKLLDEVMDMKPMIGDRELEITESSEKIMMGFEERKKRLEEVVWDRGLGILPEDRIMHDIETLKAILKEKDFIENTEKIAYLSLYVFKMAIYNFCKTGIPFIKKEANKNINGTLKIPTEQWEDFFWTGEGRVETDIIPKPELIPIGNFKDDVFQKKRDIRKAYYECFTEENIGKGFWSIYGGMSSYCVECLERAFEDDETVQAVYELQNKSLTGSTPDTEGDSIKEIQNMRHLLDIMERDVKGELTAQDKADLKDKAQE